MDRVLDTWITLAGGKASGNWTEASRKASALLCTLTDLDSLSTDGRTKSDAPFLGVYWSRLEHNNAWPNPILGQTLKRVWIWKPRPLKGSLPGHISCPKGERHVIHLNWVRHSEEMWYLTENNPTAWGLKWVQQTLAEIKCGSSCAPRVQYALSQKGNDPCLHFLPGV